MKSLSRNSLIVWLSVAFLVAPIIFYAWKFNGDISPHHKDWGDFGSFFGGVYAPIVGVFTLIIISMQMILQKRFSNFEESERLVAGVRHDIEYLLDKLEKLIFDKMLSATHSDSTVEPLLASLKVFLIIDRHHYTQSDERLETLVEFYPNLLPMWSSIANLLYKIETSSSERAKMELPFLEAKCVAVLNVNTCQALDQVMQHNMGSVIKKYYFLDACNHRNL